MLVLRCSHGRNKNTIENPWVDGQNTVKLETLKGFLPERSEQQVQVHYLVAGTSSDSPSLPQVIVLHVKTTSSRHPFPRSASRRKRSPNLALEAPARTSSLLEAQGAMVARTW